MPRFQKWPRRRGGTLNLIRSSSTSPSALAAVQSRLILAYEDAEKTRGEGFRHRSNSPRPPSAGRLAGAGRLIVDYAHPAHKRWHVNRHMARAAMRTRAHCLSLFVSPPTTIRWTSSPAGSAGAPIQSQAHPKARVFAPDNRSGARVRPARRGKDNPCRCKGPPPPPEWVDPGFYCPSAGNGVIDVQRLRMVRKTTHRLVGANDISPFCARQTPAAPLLPRVSP